jgi:hypothetical protein
MVRKKKLVFHSDFALSKTGFGRNTKAILSYLFNTGKYEIVSIAGGISKAHPELENSLEKRRRSSYDWPRTNRLQ